MLNDKEGSSLLEKEEADRLINKQFEDFERHVAGGNLSEILLKGHLLIEHYLDHVMLLVFDKKAGINKKSFATKVTQLKDKNCFFKHEDAINCLYAINRVRNDLAHRLDFKLTISQIDTIGYKFGREYILRRYAKNVNDEKLLLWVIGKIIPMVYYPIYDALLEEQSRKKTGSNH